MDTVVVACSMLSEEIKAALQELNLDNEVLYIDAALHVDLNLLEKALTDKLNEAKQNKNAVILVGNKCHPDILAIADKYNSKIVNGSNCIELLLGEEMAEYDKEAKTFYITGGWLNNWRKIFQEGLKWDPVDARQNFGYYDRIVLIDTGVSQVNDEELLEFFEYTQVPVEICPVDLQHLKKEILNILS